MFASVTAIFYDPNRARLNIVSQFYIYIFNGTNLDKDLCTSYYFATFFNCTKDYYSRLRPHNSFEAYADVVNQAHLGPRHPYKCNHEANLPAGGIDAIPFYEPPCVGLCYLKKLITNNPVVSAVVALALVACIVLWYYYIYCCNSSNGKKKMIFKNINLAKKKGGWRKMLDTSPTTSLFSSRSTAPCVESTVKKKKRTRSNKP